MIDLNQIRAVFAQHMADQPNARFSMDSALLAVCQMCYEAGAKDAGLCQADHASPTAAQPLSYVQDVPDHCDRIIWRGHYYQLHAAADHATP